MLVNSYGIVRALYKYGTEGGVNAIMKTEIVEYLARIQFPYSVQHVYQHKRNQSREFAWL